jgi:hypothetical protein
MVGGVVVKDGHEGDICVANSTEPEPRSHGQVNHAVDIDQPYQKPGEEQEKRDVDEGGHCSDY